MNQLVADLARSHRDCVHRVIVLAAIVALPSVAPAQAAPRDTTPATVDAVVVTSSRVPAVVGGAAAVVVHPDSMTALETAPSLADILRRTPFVLVRQNSRGEAELSVRGSDSRQAAVLLDGLPLSLGWDHRTDPSLLPSGGIHEVRLVRGLASLLDGPNALGGVIALRSTRGDVAPPGTAGSRTSGALAASVDHVLGRATAGSLTQRTQFGGRTLVVSGGAGYRQRRGLPLGGAGELSAAEGGGTDPGDVRDPDIRTNSDHRQVDGFAAARIVSPKGAHVGVFAAGYDAERGTPPELHVTEPRLWRYPSVRRRMAVVSGSSGLRDTPLGNGAVSVSVGGNAGDFAVEQFTDRTYATPDGGESGRERTWAGRMAASHSLPANGQVRAGVTYASVHYDERLDGGSPSSYHQQLASAGAEAEYFVGGRALVTAGVVRDVSATPESGGRPSLGRQSALGWRIGGTVDASPALSLHASLSRRARFPSLRELYSGALARFEPNPLLRPEQLLGGEVGASLFRTTQSASLTMQGVVFHHRLDDVVQRISLPDGRFRRENRDELRSTGLELLADWQGATARAPSITADVLMQRVRLLDLTGAGDGRRPEHQPQFRGSLTSAFTAAAGMRVSVAARVDGRQFCEHPDLGRQVSLGTQRTLDAAVTRGWSLTRTATAVFRVLEATLSLDNIADVTAYDQCGLPRSGRTIRAGLRLR